MSRRVVVTGMGICAPNGCDLDRFGQAMSLGVSGIRRLPELERLGFRCQVAGQPELSEDIINQYFNKVELKSFNSTGLTYGVIAGMQAWHDAGLEVPSPEAPDWDSGIVFGTGVLGSDKFRESILLVDQGQVRRVGSSAVSQTMASGISAFLGGKLGCGNQVTANSSACSTGTEAVLMGLERIRQGGAERMLAGSASDCGPYVWSGFDSMRIVPSGFNEHPEKASRPLSASAAGFVPSGGAGALLLESLESARSRKARIYAEVLGGSANSGGHRNGGSMTAANSEGVQRCIRGALADAGIEPGQVDLINGHLTATAADPAEIRNWTEALGRQGREFPYINSFKDVLGHGLAASGSMEIVAALLQFGVNLVFGNRNAEDLHPEILKLVDPSRVPGQNVDYAPQYLAKASFGFGDVNACIIFKRFNPEAL
ncbi:beta-ketoacyl-[acyl-carrier-protein] synthase family protein [Robiginitalea marina]|uniref:3-oxoacyl-[acyl-carrier-protein] synthase 1 n=1 Tax=Robiginitalea marina TaxID=2954105 RepID=A0ABT1AVX7_9FLAO|nr:beta-ketoacyl-[acyl-carrier-protein] synthase family protein [Robiginitalea marina]MCO5723503.1 beta-ketoacyl-[acyl-carrier-protein] synthase family protein [Robiginitalea marina]